MRPWLLMLAACGFASDPPKEDTPEPDTVDTVVEVDTEPPEPPFPPATPTPGPCDRAEPPTRLVLGTVPPTLTSSAEVVWEDPPQPCAETVRYEAAIGTVAFLENVAAWVDIGLVHTHVREGVTLLEGVEYYTSIRRVDAEGHVSVPASAEGWVVPSQDSADSGP